MFNAVLTMTIACSQVAFGSAFEEEIEKASVLKHQASSLGPLQYRPWPLSKNMC